jgi:hypothetical protein
MHASIASDASQSCALALQAKLAQPTREDFFFKKSEAHTFGTSVTRLASQLLPAGKSK